MWAYVIEMHRITDMDAYLDLREKWRADILERPGFVEGLLLREGPGRLTGVVTFETREAAEAAEPFVHTITRLIQVTCGPDAKVEVRRCEVLDAGGS